MEIPNVKPNSMVSKQKEAEEKRVEQVAYGLVKKRELTSTQKFFRGFLPDGTKTFKDYIITDGPGIIKRFFRELLLGCINEVLPDTGKKNPTNGQPVRVSYNNYANPSMPRARMNNTVYDYDNLVFERYDEADEVLSSMYACLDQYKFVRVADLYDLAGVPSNYTDGNYGWYDLRGANIRSVREGYMIDLPRAVARI